MSLIRIHRTASGRQLAVFAGCWLVFFAVVAGLFFLREGSKPAAILMGGLAVGVPAVGWFAPGLLRRVYIGMTFLAFPIGFVLSHLVLALVYYALMTPIGLLMRIVGHDPMTRRFDRTAKSYWIPRTRRRTVKEYFRQF